MIISCIVRDIISIRPFVLDAVYLGIDSALLMERTTERISPSF